MLLCSCLSFSLFVSLYFQLWSEKWCEWVLLSTIIVLLVPNSNISTIEKCCRPLKSCGLWFQALPRLASVCFYPSKSFEIVCIFLTFMYNYLLQTNKGRMLLSEFIPTGLLHHHQLTGLACRTPPANGVSMQDSSILAAPLSFCWLWLSSRLQSYISRSSVGNAGIFIT